MGVISSAVGLMVLIFIALVVGPLLWYLLFYIALPGFGLYLLYICLFDKPRGS